MAEVTSPPPNNSRLAAGTRAALHPTCRVKWGWGWGMVCEAPRRRGRTGEGRWKGASMRRRRRVSAGTGRLSAGNGRWLNRCRPKGCTHTQAMLSLSREGRMSSVVENTGGGCSD